VKNKAKLQLKLQEIDILVEEDQHFLCIEHKYCIVCNIIIVLYYTYVLYMKENLWNDLCPCDSLYNNRCVA